MDWRASDRGGGHHARVEVQVDLRWRGCAPAPAELHKRPSSAKAARRPGGKRLPPSRVASRYENFVSALSSVYALFCVQMLVWGLLFFYRHKQQARGHGSAPEADPSASLSLSLARSRSLSLSPTKPSNSSTRTDLHVTHWGGHILMLTLDHATVRSRTPTHV